MSDMTSASKTKAGNQHVFTNLAEYYYKKLPDVLGLSFDYIIIGGGAYGGSFAHRMLELDPKARILILEKGSIFFSDHSQNLPPEYVSAVYGPAVFPWVVDNPDKFFVAAQQPYVGGRAIFWNAWVPQPKPDEMPYWPPEVIASLEPEWDLVADLVGRRFTLACSGNDNAELDPIGRMRLFNAVQDGQISYAVPMTDPEQLSSAMAVGEGDSPHVFAKYAPVARLTKDVITYADRLYVVPLAQVVRLDIDNGQAVMLHVAHPNTPQDSTPLAVNGAKVILANNTIEAAGLVKAALPEHPLVGKNLCVHNRSALTIRVPVEQFSGELADRLQVCAYFLKGQMNAERFFHTHVSLVCNPRPKEDYAVMYRVLPDASSQQAVDIYETPGYVYILLQTLGEVLGERSPESWNYVTAQGEDTIVRFVLREEDHQGWDMMDRFTWDAARALVGDATTVEYQLEDKNGGTYWTSTPPTSIKATMVFHEAGTFWMGDNPGGSVTDLNGRMHDVENLYGTGSMLFPSPGSWNPTFTGIAMAYALARTLTEA
jgi:hypothetical protein